MRAFFMTTDRVNARLPKILAQHVAFVVDQQGIYETPSEYIRDLIRKDLENPRYQIFNQIAEGFHDIEEGRYFESSGNWKEDKQRFQDMESQNWK